MPSAATDTGTCVFRWNAQADINDMDNSMVTAMLLTKSSWVRDHDKGARLTAPLNRCTAAACCVLPPTYYLLPAACCLNNDYLLPTTLRTTCVSVYESMCVCVMVLGTTAYARMFVTNTQVCAPMLSRAHMPPCIETTIIHTHHAQARTNTPSH